MVTVVVVVVVYNGNYNRSGYVKLEETCQSNNYSNDLIYGNFSRDGQQPPSLLTSYQPL